MVVKGGKKQKSKKLKGSKRRERARKRGSGWLAHLRTDWRQFDPICLS